MYSVTITRFGRTIETSTFKNFKGAAAYAAAMRLMGYDIDMQEIAHQKEELAA